MPFTISNDLKTEKNRLEQKNPWIKLIKVEAFSHANLLLRSQELDHAAWSKSNITVTANNIEAPDGNVTAERVAVDVANGEIRQDYAIADPENRTFTFSVFVKAGTINPDSANFKIKIRRGNDSDETVVNGNTVAWIPYHNQWLRGKVTKTFSASTSGDNVRVILSAAVTGNFYAWGAMLEESANLTFYLPTSTATVTTSNHHVVNFDRFVTFDSYCYTPFPVQVGAMKAATKGEMPSVSLSVSNVGKYLMAYMKANKGLIGKTVTIYLVHSSFLNDPTNSVIPETLMITGSTVDEIAGVFNLGVGVNAHNIEGPIGEFNRTICPAMPIVSPRISIGVI